jgi:hypothetical protein
MTEQTWLSLSGICDKLRLSTGQVRTLVKKGCLATIGKQAALRFLDPTPEYVEQLRLGAIIHQKHFPVPAGLTEKALLTKGECAELLGLSARMMERYLYRHTVPSIRVDKKHFLYSPLVVREAMLKRSKKTLSKQKSAYLLADMISLFRSRLTAELSLIPTDKEFAADEALQQRLAMIVTESQKADFAHKVKLAQQIVQILESAARD